MYLKKLIEFISKLLLMLLMSFSFVYPITTTLSFKCTPQQVSGIILVILVLLSVLLINRTMTKITIIATISGSVIFVVYSFFSGLILHYTKPFIWLYDYIQSTEIANESFTLGYTLVFSFIFSLIVYIFTVKKFNFYIVFLVGLSIFCSQWILSYFAPDAYISFYTFVGSIIIYYFLHIYNRKSARQSNDFVNLSSFIMLALPVSLLVLLLTAIIPVNQRPIEWKWLDEKINYAFGYTNNNGKAIETDYFSLSAAGFGDSTNRLGGNITLNNTKVLKVNSPKVIYLKGRSCDKYTGNSWVNSTISYSDIDDLNNKLHFDAYELENGYSFLLNNTKTNINSLVQDYFSGNSYAIDNIPGLSINKINVTYADITTKSIFAHNKSYKFNFSNIDSNDVFANAEGILLSHNSLSRDFQYSFYTYNLDYSNKDFQSFMRASERFLYDSCLEDSINYISKIINVEIQNVLINHNIHTSDFLFDDLYQQLTHEIIPNSPSTEAMMNNLRRYLIIYFSSILDMSDEENQILVISIIEECFRNINSGYYKNSFEEIITLKQLIDNSNEINTKYLDVPLNVPNRVKDLAISITKNENNNYDKVKAIEQYLSKNYKYSLTPGNPPKNSDFVDYFLFVHKEGYCTYFATAMSILTRCVGIPSRYVEGYLLPSRPVRGDLYEVTNEQAHAWVEVYFEGVGWIQFEPTSSFGGNLYQQTEYNQNNQSAQPTGHIMPGKTSSPANTNNFPEQQTNITKTDYTKLIVIILSILFVILALFLIVLANILRRKKILSNITKLAPREGVLELYNYYMKYLIYQKAGFAGGETPMEHAKRLDNIGRLFPYKIQEITKIFIDARYSQKEISQRDFDKVLSFYPAVLKSSRENLGIARYTLFMYILFKL